MFAASTPILHDVIPDDSPIVYCQAFLIKANKNVVIGGHTTITLDTGIVLRVPSDLLGHLTPPSKPLASLKVWATTISCCHQDSIKLQISNISDIPRMILPNDILGQVIFSEVSKVRIEKENQAPSGDHQGKLELENLSGQLDGLDLTTHPTEGETGLEDISEEGEDTSEDSTDSGFLNAEPPLPHVPDENVLPCSRCHPKLDIKTNRISIRLRGPHEKGCVQRRSRSRVSFNNSRNNPDPDWKPRQRRPNTPYPILKRLLRGPAHKGEAECQEI
jgi:dUTPase